MIWAMPGFNPSVAAVRRGHRWRLDRIDAFAGWRISRAQAPERSPAHLAIGLRLALHAWIIPAIDHLSMTRAAGLECVVWPDNSALSRVSACPPGQITCE